jgi:Protein of unknown function (DUF1553)/Protein of unknown function (DUF1549)
MIRTFVMLYLGLASLDVQVAWGVDFDTEIVPVLTKSGCNAGACHGAAAGRGGFHLSLLGANPSADFQAIVHELEGRRINQARVDRSLLLAKPTGLLDHGGEVALDDDGAELLRDWIVSGAPRGQPRLLTSFQVKQSRDPGNEIPSRIRLQATARFDSSEPEDVSRWTVFSPADPGAVEIDNNQIAHVKRRGQHTIIARFLNRVVPIQLNIPMSDKPIDLSNESRNSFIDDEVLRVLSELRIPVSPPASDAEWLRRVTLDLTGRLPQLSAIERYLANKSHDRRQQVVEELLVSDAFSDYWTLRFSRLLRMHSQPNDKEGLKAYSTWLRQEIQAGTGLDRIAYQLLTATGDSHEIGPANFGRMVNDAREHAELAGQFFLGVRLGCANCHNHPLDKWTQDDYHGFAAAFAKLDRGRIVKWTTRGAVTNLRTNEPAIPRIPGHRDLTGSGDYREDIATWLTSEGKDYFARATVNRLWQAMFGRGFVEPTDDLRETNPPTHPELLDRLADDFVKHGYRIRHTLQQIALSSTYARSSISLEGNKSDDRFYSHAYNRPLLPEVLVDAIADVTGVADRFEGQANDIRAIAIVDPLAPAPSLDILGRCTKVRDCDETGKSSSGLASQLHLLNGELLNRKLVDEHGRLSKMIASKASVQQVISRFFLLALSRPPTDAEVIRWSKRIEDVDPIEQRKKIEDFVWSLLNSRAFLQNQ